MEETELFLYEVEQADDIYYNGGGPPDLPREDSDYLHTVVIGFLREGAMHRGDVIVLPGEQGTDVIGYVRYFEVYHKIWPNLELHARDASSPVAVVVFVKEPRPTNIQSGVAKGYSPEQYKAKVALSRDTN